MKPFFNKINFRSKFEFTKSWPAGTIAKGLYNDFSEHLHFQIFIPDLCTVILCELKTLEHFEGWIWKRYNEMNKCQHSFKKINLGFTNEMCEKCDYFQLKNEYIEKIKLDIQCDSYGLVPEILEIGKYCSKYNECY
ncbi:hypothetical protein GCL60_09930 [Silvanigrella paludirubra]|uniref:Uncharacterized protein n=1 Tax=Silvanigrella paludirubra TaxID=2499159 RepID=A0A6N6VYF6_9BACT|nr:hypothetical protein [Silvanigrella paludirubra]KAB8039165.1 hypothetical protein GCL60_09930 [Silvanigrella paludirubra]